MTTEELLWISGLTLAGWMMLRPLFPGRRRLTGGVPQPHLAAGPLVPVPPAVYYGGTPSRVIAAASWPLGVGAVALGVATARAESDDSAALWFGLAATSAIVAATFVASNWFATHMRQRVDDVGLHSRLLFKEHTLPWHEVSSLSLRHVRVRGLSLVYYCVRSPTREFAFPHTQPGADTLRRTIEEATGMTWPDADLAP